MTNCVAPQCMCTNRSKQKCSKPNHWNLFRFIKRGMYNQRMMSAKYRSKVKHITDAQWCDMANQLGKNECINITDTETSDGTNTCDALLEYLIKYKSYQKAADRWKRVMRLINKRVYPRNITQYSNASLRYIADIVGEAFFGKEFISELRSDLHLTITLDTSQPMDRTPILGVTVMYDMNQTGIELNAVAIDHMFNNSRTIYDNGVKMNNKVEWVTHIIAQELLKCLMHFMCRHMFTLHDNSIQMFEQLNKHLFGFTELNWSTA